MFCHNHKKPVEKVLATIKVSFGIFKTASYCKICDDLIQFKFTCKKCKSKNDYYCSVDCYDYKCLWCRDTGEDLLREKASMNIGGKRMGWLLDERKWHDDIRSRKIAPDKSIVRVPHGKKGSWEE